ncbi:MAG: TetR/AcrR family transcriptional regulator [Phycisphaeraceae bacterium]|nr:MAG: TetR/AcrR family transcriptional regulator [Phycisphaeraceae bacterium]
MSRLPAAQRREQLLDHAAVLFAKGGYARATTAELAKAAGITEPIIYRHFASKRDLFIALINRSSERTLAFWEAHLAGATDPAERLRRLVGDNPMVAEQTRDAYRVLLQAITEVDDEQIHHAVSRHIGNLHAFLRTELELAQAEHKVNPRISADLIAWLLIDVGMGYGVLNAMRIPGHGTDPTGQHVQDLINRLLIARSPKPGDTPDDPAR